MARNRDDYQSRIRKHGDGRFEGQHLQNKLLGNDARERINSTLKALGIYKGDSSRSDIKNERQNKDAELPLWDMAVSSDNNSRWSNRSDSSAQNTAFNNTPNNQRPSWGSAPYSPSEPSSFGQQQTYNASGNAQASVGPGSLGKFWQSPAPVQNVQTSFGTSGAYVATSSTQPMFVDMTKKPSTFVNPSRPNLKPLVEVTIANPGALAHQSLQQHQNTVRETPEAKRERILAEENANKPTTKVILPSHEDLQLYQNDPQSGTILRKILYGSRAHQIEIFQELGITEDLKGKYLVPWKCYICKKVPQTWQNYISHCQSKTHIRLLDWIKKTPTAVQELGEILKILPQTTEPDCDDAGSDRPIGKGASFNHCTPCGRYYSDAAGLLKHKESAEHWQRVHFLKERFGTSWEQFQWYNQAPKTPGQHTEEPVGVAFIVPISGFFCKLCSQFYNSEVKAKDMHCRESKHIQKVKDWDRSSKGSMVSLAVDPVEIAAAVRKVDRTPSPPSRSPNRSRSRSRHSRQTTGKASSERGRSKKATGTNDDEVIMVNDFSDVSDEDFPPSRQSRARSNRKNTPSRGYTSLEEGELSISEVRQLERDQEKQRIVKEWEKREQQRKKDRDRSYDRERERREKDRKERHDRYDKRDRERAEEREKREEKQRREKEETERLRREKEQLEKERKEKERLEKERMEREKQERARLERERLEKERLEKERLEKERLEKERLERERIERERLERIERERLERVKREKEEQERKEKEKREKEERERKERIEAERREKERIEQEKRDRLRQEQEKQIQEERRRLQEAKEQLEKTRKMQEQREDEFRENQMKERALLEKRIWEQQMRERELMEQQLKQQQMMEKQQLEQSMRDRYTDRERMSDRQRQEQEMREQELYQQQMREREVREMELRKRQEEEFQRLQDEQIREQELREREMRERGRQEMVIREEEHRRLERQATDLRERQMNAERLLQFNLQEQEARDREIRDQGFVEWQRRVSNMREDGVPEREILIRKEIFERDIEAMIVKDAETRAQQLGKVLHDNQREGDLREKVIQQQQIRERREILIREMREMALKELEMKEMDMRQKNFPAVEIEEFIIRERQAYDRKILEELKLRGLTDGLDMGEEQRGDLETRRSASHERDGRNHSRERDWREQDRSEDRSTTEYDRKDERSRRQDGRAGEKDLVVHEMDGLRNVQLVGRDVPLNRLPPGDLREELRERHVRAGPDNQIRGEDRVHRPANKRGRGRGRGGRRRKGR